MKNMLAGAVIAALFALTGFPARGEAALVVQNIIEPGGCKEFRHPSDIVLSNGFWAKAGSDVTATIDQSEGPGTQGLLGMINVVCETKDPGPRLPLTEGRDYSGSLDAQLGVLSPPVLVQVGTNVKLPNPTQFYAVTGIWIIEESNNPCRIILEGHMVDPRFRTRSRPLGEFALDSCKTGIVTYIDSRNVGFDGPDNQFIRGLRVCMGGKDPIPPFGSGFDNTEIKGLRIRPAAVSENGAVEPQDDVKEWARPHCPDKERGDSREGWASLHTCPADEIVTGGKCVLPREGVRRSRRALHERAVTADAAGAREGRSWLLIEPFFNPLLYLLYAPT
jgi:hypothetical protein